MTRWMLSYALALLSLVGVGWPPRARVDAPRTGIPAEPGATPGSVRYRATTSLPWVLPGAFRKAWVEEQGGQVRWASPNRADVEVPAPRTGHGSRFRIVQVADLIIPGREALMEQFLLEMERLRPDAVLVTGDIAYAESRAWYDAMLGYFRRLELQGIPVLAAPGNHERKAWPEYLRAFGPLGDHCADLGPLRVISLDSAHGRDRLTPSQLGWLRDCLERAGDKVTVIQLHHPVFPAGPAQHGEAGGSGGSLQGFQKAFVDLCVQHRVAAVLSGHWHADAVFDAQGRLRDDTADFPGPKFIVTTALGNELRRVTRWPEVHYGYRVLEFEGGRLARYTHGDGPDGKPRPIASTPLGLPPGLKEFPR
ncbi:MAG: metallophosphoesterase [Acidobacteria bacterium]|nr:metallophosphoesterase [Acidobacteriota bacterium]